MPDLHFEIPGEADRQRPWSWDYIHGPRPLPPLAAETWGTFMSAFMGRRPLFLHGYPYLPGPEPGAAQPAPPPPPPSDPTALWEQELRPQIEVTCARITGEAWREREPAALAAELPAIFLEAGQAFGKTMAPLFGLMPPVLRLIAFAEANLSPGGRLLALTMLQGGEQPSSAAALALEDLAELARKLPPVAEALHAGRFADIREITGGAAFATALDTFLEEHGRCTQTWAEIHVPTWREEPAPALQMVRTFLDDPDASPRARQQQAREAAAQAITDAMARLGEDDAAELRALLHSAHSYTAVLEDRARWQLNLLGAARQPCVALGQLLAARGLLSDPGDVFFFSAEELGTIARGQLIATPGLIADRRAAHELARTLVPPTHIGAAGGAPHPISTLLFGHGLPAGGGESVVTGLGASAGTARGRARVVLDLSDAEALEPGDILVCRATAPPWTPLFAVASAVVADSGGLLSHSASVAREYGIPCVVGTQDATRRIPDGAMVTVDGEQGIVRIEG